MALCLKCREHCSVSIDDDGEHRSSCCCAAAEFVEDEDIEEEEKPGHGITWNCQDCGKELALSWSFCPDCHNAKYNGDGSLKAVDGDMAFKPIKAWFYYLDKAHDPAINDAAIRELTNALGVSDKPIPVTITVGHR